MFQAVRHTELVAVTSKTSRVVRPSGKEALPLRWVDDGMMMEIREYSSSIKESDSD